MDERLQQAILDRLDDGRLPCNQAFAIAQILGMEPQGKKQVVKAQVPLAEMYKYSSTLRSISQGRGSHKMTFVAYEQVPPNVAEKVIEEAKAREEEEGKK